MHNWNSIINWHNNGCVYNQCKCILMQIHLRRNWENWISLCHMNNCAFFMVIVMHFSLIYSCIFFWYCFGSHMRHLSPEVQHGAKSFQFFNRCSCFWSLKVANKVQIVKCFVVFIFSMILSKRPVGGQTQVHCGFIAGH